VSSDFDSSEFRALFVGRETVTFGWVKFGFDENGVKTVFVRKESLFKKSWIPVFHNLDGKTLLKHFEERYLLKPSRGRTNDVIRVYWFDFDSLEKFTGRLNPEELAGIEAGRVEATYHELVAGDAKEFSEVSASSDLLREKSKDDIDYVRSLFPRSAGSDDGKGGKKK